MKHRARARKLGRSTPHRLSMLRNMVTSLLDHEQIRTTDAKAREVRRVAERMITLGKRGDLHARRRALRVIRERAVAAKVFDELAERYRERPGGYTRVVKLGRRHGDAAPVSIVQLLPAEAPPAEKPAKKGRAAKKKARAEKAEAPARKAEAKKKTTKKKPATKKAATKKTAARKTTKKKTAKKTGKKSSRRKSD